MSSLSETLKRAQAQGYNENFKLVDKTLVDQRGAIYPKRRLNIDFVERTEASSDPGQQAIVYGISTDLDDTKGILVNGHGTQSDLEIHNFINELEALN